MTNENWNWNLENVEVEKPWLEFVEKVDYEEYWIASIDWLKSSKNSTWVRTLCMPLGIFCEGQNKKIAYLYKIVKNKKSLGYNKKSSQEQL